MELEIGRVESSVGATGPCYGPCYGHLGICVCSSQRSLTQVSFPSRPSLKWASEPGPTVQRISFMSRPVRGLGLSCRGLPSPRPRIQAPFLMGTNVS